MRLPVALQLLCCLPLLGGAGAVPPESAQGKTPFQLTFDDSGSILQSVPIGPDQWAEIEEMHIKLKGSGTIFDKMKATCVAMTPEAPGSPSTAGWCEFKDGDGDRTIEYFRGDITDAGGQGTASFRNGTGKFAGMRSEHTWTYHFTWKSDDAYTGAGHKRGVYWFEDAATGDDEL